jgi:hypothetical protein
MNEEVPIIPLVIGVLALALFGFEVDRRRAKLRSIFCTFDREESEVAETLEAMVRSGALKPYSPARPA